MSKYWNQMNIMRKHKRNNNNLFLSYDKPKFITFKKYDKKSSYESSFSENELTTISDFYCRKYRVNKSIITQLVSCQDLNRYLYFDSALISVFNNDDNNNIIGSIISFPIPVIINIIQTDNNRKLSLSDKVKNHGTEDSFFFSCTSFLVVDDKYRKKGYGMALIQESLKLLHDLGGLGAYFINNVSRSDNSIVLYIWFYPINLEKIKPFGFISHNGYEYLFQSENSENKNSDSQIWQISTVRIGSQKGSHIWQTEQSYNFYMNAMKGKKFYFSPSFSYWEKWIESFPTFVIYEKDEIIGLFSFNMMKLYHPGAKYYLELGYLIICVGKQPETLKAAITISRTMFDVIYLYELSDINITLLKSISAQPMSKYYINFYNTNISLKSEDFYSPIF